MQLSLNTQKISSLERQNKALRPQKRARVKENPNHKFSRVADLDEEARRFEAILNNTPTPEGVENLIFEELCHYWILPYF